VLLEQHRVESRREQVGGVLQQAVWDARSARLVLLQNAIAYFEAGVAFEVSHFHPDACDEQAVEVSLVFPHRHARGHFPDSRSFGGSFFFSDQVTFSSSHGCADVQVAIRFSHQGAFSSSHGCASIQRPFLFSNQGALSSAHGYAHFKVSVGFSNQGAFSSSHGCADVQVSVGFSDGLEITVRFSHESAVVFSIAHECADFANAVQFSHQGADGSIADVQVSFPITHDWTVFQVAFAISDRATVVQIAVQISF
jgi:hypothetical protein